MKYSKGILITMGCLAMLLSSNRSFADKDMAQVYVAGSAQVKYRNIQISGKTVQEKDWWVEITFRNDGNENMIINPYDFTIKDSAGKSYNYIDIPDIPKINLLTNLQIQPRSTIKKTLGYRARSTNSYPVEITYENSSAMAYGKITLNTQDNQPGVKAVVPTLSTNTSASVQTLSPQEMQAQRANTKAAKDATFASDSAVGILEQAIVNKYIKLQNSNKQKYETKMISFDVFNATKDKLEKKKEQEIIAAHEQGKTVYNNAFTHSTAEYYRQTQ